MAKTRVKAKSGIVSQKKREALREKALVSAVLLIPRFAERLVAIQIAVDALPELIELREKVAYQRAVIDRLLREKADLHAQLNARGYTNGDVAYSHETGFSLQSPEQR